MPTHRVFAGVLLTMLSFSVAIAQNAKQSLLVVHVDGGTGFKQKIFSYHFLNGSFTGREEVMAFNGKREGKDYVRTDLGRNTVYKNRYVITGIGNVLDLQEKTVLYDGRGQLLFCRNDSAVFYINDLFRGKYYAVYDFKNRKYGEVKDLLFAPKLGRDIEIDKTQLPLRVFYYPKGKPKQLLIADAGYGQMSGKTLLDPPLVWLDQQQFMYLSFNKDNTEASVMVFNADTKANTTLGKVNIAKEVKPAEVYKLDDGRWMLNYGARRIVIDTKAATVTELDYSLPADGFNFEMKAGPKGRTVKLNGKEIGKISFQPANFATAPNICGVVKEMTIGADSYQQGLSVWNVTKQTWERVEADEVLTVIGFIPE